jgi:hypothetical protein
LLSERVSALPLDLLNCTDGKDSSLSAERGARRIAWWLHGHA